MKTNLIYGLRDPRNDVYRYIGKTTIGNTRPLSHLVKSHNSLVTEWVNELKTKGLIPYVDILEKDIELDNLSERERYWISYYSEICGDLFNGGKSIKETIKSPSSLQSIHVENAMEALNNIGDIYKILKTSTGFSGEKIATILNVGRKTVYRIKNNETNITLDTIVRLLFFTKYTLEDVFNFYYEKSNEFLGNYPDTLEDFIKRCDNDSHFMKTWYDKFYKNKRFSLNEVKM